MLASGTLEQAFSEHPNTEQKPVGLIHPLKLSRSYDSSQSKIGLQKQDSDVLRTLLLEAVCRVNQPQLSTV